MSRRDVSLQTAPTGPSRSNFSLELMRRFSQGYASAAAHPPCRCGPICSALPNPNARRRRCWRISGLSTAPPPPTAVGRKAAGLQSVARRVTGGERPVQRANRSAASAAAPLASVRLRFCPAFGPFPPPKLHFSLRLTPGTAAAPPATEQPETLTRYLPTPEEKGEKGMRAEGRGEGGGV